MCCETNTPNDCCKPTCCLEQNPALWSKKKKISVLETQLSSMQEKVQDVEQLIDELKAEQ